MAGKSGFMKDAFILFAITLISGIALGGVYEVTKGPIEQATIEANNKTYRGVFPEASSFEETSDIDLEACNTDVYKRQHLPRPWSRGFCWPIFRVMWRKKDFFIPRIRERSSPQ